MQEAVSPLQNILVSALSCIGSSDGDSIVCLLKIHIRQI